MKYHIKADGTPGVCRATTRPCPLGGAEAHFDSAEEAQAFIDEQNEAQFGLFAEEKTFEAESPFGISREELLKEEGDLNAIAALDLAMNEPSFFAAASDNFEDNGRIDEDIIESMRERGLIRDSENIISTSQYEAVTQGLSEGLPRRKISDEDLKKAGLTKKMRRYMRAPLRTEGTGTAFVIDKGNGNYESVTQLEAMVLNPHPEWARSMTEGIQEDYPGHIYQDYKIRSENRPITEEQFKGSADVGAALVYQFTEEGMTDGMTDGYIDESLSEEYIDYGKSVGIFKGDVMASSDYKGNASELPRATLSEDDLARLGISPNLFKVSSFKDDGSAAIVVKDENGYRRYTDSDATLIHATSTNTHDWREQAEIMMKVNGEKFKDIF